MKTLMKTILFTLLAIHHLTAANDLNKLTVSSALWSHLEATTILLYPQSSFSAPKDTPLAKTVQLKSIYDKEHLALLLQWNDPTHSLQHKDQTNSFGDGFAIQFPVNYHDPKDLPYIGMGDEKRAVVLYLHKNVQEFNALKVSKDQVSLEPKDHYAKAFLAHGYGTMEEIAESGFTTQMRYQKGTYQALFITKRENNHIKLDKQALIFSLAIWDGGKKQRDGIKMISGWQGASLIDDPTQNNTQKLDDIFTTLHHLPKGDAKAGKELFHQQCAACHVTQADQKNSQYLGPNLMNIGGYATSWYIKESIQSVAKVCIPGQHMRTKKIYEMPDFSWLDEDAVNNLVLYLKSLKSGVER
jgi:complex iron-sulfur molybdoenzyme family reductase subunit gamma